MEGPTKKYSCRQRSINSISNLAKIVLPLIFIVVTGCQKDPNNIRVLPAGTQCTINSGVFAVGDKQPVAPLTVISEYRGASSGLIFYNVQDANGVIWQIPDNDLKISK